MAELNPAQAQAVKHLDGPSLVIAGAGSGKTRVITAKLLHLIDAGFTGRAIAAITFTNKAAAEMAERFAQQRKLPASERPTISTFHSLGMKMLRTSGRGIGLKPSFSIFDSDDCAGLLAQLLQTTDRKLIRLAATRISLWKNAMVEPETALKEARGESELRIARAYMEYQATLEGYQAVDFDDLIRLPLKLLRQDEEARRLWQEKLRYFLVDEYQDTNVAQYALLKELVGNRTGLTAVGDDDQSIYGWRGASLENLKRLGQDFPNLTVIKLEQNYRSTRTILHAANTLIAKNPKLYTKTLWSALGEGDPLKVLPCDDDEDEAETVVKRIQALREAPEMVGLRRALPRQPPGAGHRADASQRAHPLSDLRRPVVLRPCRDQGPVRLPAPAGQRRRRSGLHPRRHHAATRHRPTDPQAAG